jgi:hypothetical protein
LLQLRQRQRQALAQTMEQVRTAAVAAGCNQQSVELGIRLAVSQDAQ